jgi:hypothetical protein
MRCQRDVCAWGKYVWTWPIRVAVRSTAWVYGRLFSGNANSNPARGRYVYVFWVFCVCVCLCVFARARVCVCVCARACVFVCCQLDISATSRSLVHSSPTVCVVYVFDRGTSQNRPWSSRGCLDKKKNVNMQVCNSVFMFMSKCCGLNF